MSTGKPAVVLLSGGLDSATVLAIAREQGFEPVTLTFRYGQRHAQEIDVAAALAKANGIKRHVVADIDLRAFGGSALTADIDVPKHRSDAEIGDGIPVTYVPARNTVFLSYALALAETTEAFDVFIGVNALDYSGYPDCRPEFVKAFEDVMNLATKAGVEGERPFTLHTPLIDMTKAEIVTRGTALGVDYAHTLSCYDPTEDGRHCGDCDACHLRKKGFKDAGLDDPTPYAA
ncbi:MAG: 7-cyano-7-deazaguanine synthase QueC [Rhodospirillales bacterium]|nr:7-cyano-7-deazaguanine synthase QueC [Rhodospirillales bacterium]MBO6785338.1 7-cyano-7-deazaguanine synthase QueC [Rhodospirillales bacterium]